MPRSKRTTKGGSLSRAGSSLVSTTRSKVAGLSIWQKEAVRLQAARPKGFKILPDPEDIESCEKMAAGLLIFPSTIQFKLFTKLLKETKQNESNHEALNTSLIDAWMSKGDPTNNSTHGSSGAMIPAESNTTNEIESQPNSGDPVLLEVMDDTSPNDNSISRNVADIFREARENALHEFFLEIRVKMAQIVLISKAAAAKGREVVVRTRKASGKKPKGNNLQVQKALDLVKEAEAWAELKESGVLRSTRRWNTMAALQEHCKLLPTQKPRQRPGVLLSPTYKQRYQGRPKEFHAGKQKSTRQTRASKEAAVERFKALGQKFQKAISASEPPEGGDSSPFFNDNSDFDLESNLFSAKE
ncbi:hypothetical protein BGX38DRAFT_1269481 [Terfezia claveryi]|nr:hypothetical protein BGX38DRAFT_1269481 [Terfezia claveryi]